eukprot:Selendium_serpulae@DN4660_c0_g1_i1.p1
MMNASGLSVVHGKGIVRHELLEEQGRQLPTVKDAGHFNTPAGSKGNSSCLRRDLTAVAPDKFVPTLKIDHEKKAQSTNVFDKAGERNKGGISVEDHRPLMKKVPGMKDSMGVGKELPEEQHRRLVKAVPNRQEDSLNFCGPQAEVEPTRPPKRNTGPMMSTLGASGGNLVPVRGRDIKLKPSTDDTPEIPPEVLDTMRGKKGQCANAGRGRGAPFAQGNDLGGGVRRRPMLKCVKREIGEAPFAVGPPPPNQDPAVRKALIRPEPFGTGVVPPGFCDSVSEQDQKTRITKAKMAVTQTPFATERDSAPLQGSENLDAIAKTTRINKAKKEIQPAPFATDRDTKNLPREVAFKTDRPVKAHHQRKDAPFATGLHMDGSYVHKPTTGRVSRECGGKSTVAGLFAAEAPTPRPAPVAAPAPAPAPVAAPEPAPVVAAGA